MEFMLNKHSSSLAVYHPGLLLIHSPLLSVDSEPTQFATTALAQLLQVVLVGALLYLQLGKLTPLKSKSGEAFGKIYKMTSRIKKPPSPSLCGSIMQGFTVWMAVSVSWKIPCNGIVFICWSPANCKSKVVLQGNQRIRPRFENHHSHSCEA